MLTIQGMLNIHKYIGYCMDEGYVDRGKYSEEAAETIKAGRTLEMKDDIVRRCCRMRIWPHQPSRLWLSSKTRYSRCLPN